MTNPRTTLAQGILVEEEVQFTLIELCRVCQVDREQLIALVDEGVLAPSGDDPQSWRFGDASFGRARAALRLIRDLELNIAGVALVLELLDEIEALRLQMSLTRG